MSIVSEYYNIDFHSVTYFGALRVDLEQIQFAPVSEDTTGKDAQSKEVAVGC